MKEVLEVGDVLYAYARWGDGVSSRIVIERVTPTQAVSGSTRLYKALEKSYNSTMFDCAKEVGCRDNWYLETEELKGKYEHFKLLSKARNLKADLSSLTMEQLRQYIALFTPLTNS